MPPTTYSAGTVLSAAEALTGDQQVFTREQVACLLSLALAAGRTWGATEDVAEQVAVWEVNLIYRATYEERVADRIRAMEDAGDLARLRAGKPARTDYMGGPVPLWGEDGEPYNALTARDRQNLETGLKIKPVGNQGQPGSREYAEGWRQMRAHLTPYQWHVLTGADNAALGPRTISAIRELDRADQAAQQGRHLRLVKETA